MEGAEVLLQIAIILAGARLAGEIAMHLGAPSVIGELLVGVLLGPSQLGWIHPSELLRLLADIGIILLLFQVGLETNIRRLTETGTEAGVVAVGGVVIPMLGSFLLCRYAFDMSLLISLFVGGAMTATSIGVTVRILRDVGRDDSREGQIVLGAAVLDDVLGVLVLAFLFQMSVAHDVGYGGLLNLLAFIGLFFIVSPIVAELASAVISRYGHVTELPGLVATLIVSLVLFFAWIAHAVGAPELLGGFVVGLALSRQFFLPFGEKMAPDAAFTRQVRREMRPIVQLFTPIFFVGVGLSLDLRMINWDSPFVWLFSFSLAVVAIGGKVLAGHLLRGEPRLVRQAVGMAMVPRAEVGLIFAELGRSAGALDGEVYAAVVLVIAYTTVFAPFWLKLFYRRFGGHAALSRPP
ncbi:cation:proton antiporter [Congregibacter sp.]|uniref:cation:proton antiporter n=1 Tax=Congregibacter sp. TaxID=2744308 RepID=UPI003F6AC421